MKMRGMVSHRRIFFLKISETVKVHHLTFLLIHEVKKLKITTYSQLPSFLLASKPLTLSLSRPPYCLPKKSAPVNPQKSLFFCNHKWES
jgi:hypothetical protein